MSELIKIPLDITGSNASQLVTAITSGLTVDTGGTYVYTDYNLTTWGRGRLNTSTMERLFPNTTARPVKCDCYISFHRATAILFTMMVSVRVTVDDSIILDGGEDSASVKKLSKTGITDSAVLNCTKNSQIEFRIKNDTTRHKSYVDNMGIAFYFNRYNFISSAGSGIASATCENITSNSSAYGSSNGFDGDEIVFSCTVSSGYTFDGWYDGDTRVSTALTYTHTVDGADLTLEARASSSQKYSFTAIDGEGTWNASAEPAVGSPGESIVFNCSLYGGYTFDGWYDGDTKISSSQRYTHIVGNSDLTLEARAIEAVVVIATAMTGVASVTINGQPSPLTVPKSETLTLSCTLLPGYIFERWHETYRGFNYYDQTLVYDLTQYHEDRDLVLECYATSPKIRITANYSAGVIGATILKGGARTSGDYGWHIDKSIINDAGELVSCPGWLVTQFFNPVTNQSYNDYVLQCGEAHPGYACTDQSSAENPNFHYTQPADVNPLEWNQRYRGFDTILRLCVQLSSLSDCYLFNATENSYLLFNGKLVDTGVRYTFSCFLEDGFTFDGWYNSAGNKVSSETIFDMEVSQTTDLVLTARAVTPLITVSASAGTGVISATVNNSPQVSIHSGDIVNLSCVIAEGYTFDGWYVDGVLVTSAQTTQYVARYNCAFVAKAVPDSTIPVITSVTLDPKEVNVNGQFQLHVTVELVPIN